MFIVLYPTGVAGELGVCFKAIPALLEGGYEGVNMASPVLSHVIRPLLASGSRLVPFGAYITIALMYESQIDVHCSHLYCNCLLYHDTVCSCCNVIMVATTDCLLVVNVCLSCMTLLRYVLTV